MPGLAYKNKNRELALTRSILFLGIAMQAIVKVFNFYNK
jgi:hypothetical protein